MNDPAPDGFRAQFRRAHPALKASVSVCFVLLGLLGLEAASWAILTLRFGGKPQPQFIKRLSGYQVFAQSADHDLGTPIGGGSPARTDRYGLIARAPVELAKPEGTVRVVVTGGSTLAGSGQLRGRGYEAVRAYPTGIYGFEASIAGRLEAHLRAAFPGRPVEVINAAYYQKTLHQSLLHYLELLSRLDPDVVVNLDGYNDHDLLQGDPYGAHEARWLDAYAELHRTAQRDERSWTRALVEGALRTYAPSMAPGAPGPTEAGPPGGSGLQAKSEADYAAQKAQLFEGAERWLQVLEHYMAVLERDGTRWVFALQPMIARRRNKTLSTTEQGFLALEGDDSVRRFFLDDLSQRLAERVGARGFGYLDLGVAIEGLGADVEFYTDYCHLTPEGNDVVAKHLAAAVVAQLGR